MEQTGLTTFCFGGLSGSGLMMRCGITRRFSKNRDRLLEADVAREVPRPCCAPQGASGFLSDDHFSVDGTLIEAWASMKSFRRRTARDDHRGPGRNGERDFHGEKRSNDTHVSTTDPEAQLYKKGHGQEAKLCFMGHALMENRNGLVVAGDREPRRAARPSGTPPLSMIERRRRASAAHHARRRQGL